jgi:hypothetical protein
MTATLNDQQKACDDAKNQVTLDRRDLWDCVRGAIHAALSDKIPKDCVASWAWEEATNRTFDIFRKIVDTAPLPRTSDAAADEPTPELCRHCDMPVDAPGFCVCNGSRYEREQRRASAAPAIAAHAAHAADLATIVEQLALKHIAPNAKTMFPDKDYRETEQYRRVLAFAEELLAVSTPAATAPAALTDEPVERFLGEVRAELLRARAKFPGDRIMTIALAEEFGELCKAVLDERAANVRKEAVQTAVMCARVVLDGDGSVNDWRAERGLDPLVEAKHG